MSQSISLSNMIKVTRIYFINDKQLLSNSRGHQSVMSTWKITLLTILQRNAICYINFTLHYYIYINETYNSCFCIQGIYIYIYSFISAPDWLGVQWTHWSSMRNVSCRSIIWSQHSRIICKSFFGIYNWSILKCY